MTRILTLSCIFLALATFAMMSDKPTVTISTSAPQIVNPGDEFMVSINIEKGTLKKGAVLQQIIPAGFTATAIENEGSQFYFENQMVRFVWEKMPDKPVIVLAYLLKSDLNSSVGFKKLEGTFISEQNNSTAQITIPSNTFFVTNDFPVSGAKAFTGNSGSLKVLRSIEEKKGEVSTGYRVNIDVSNQNESGFASWTDQIPAGYSVEVNAANNGIFSREGAFIKFNWKEMPVEKTWSFSYTIFPSPELDVEAAPSIQGIMIYGSDESLQTFIPAAITLPKIAGANPVAAVVISAPDDEVLTEPIVENVPENKTEISSESETTIQSEEISEPIDKEPVASANARHSVMPNVQRGIYYRVQIAATKRSPTRDSEFFETRYHITRPVDMVEQDGWKKYCIGTFARLEPAKAFEMETREHISDAFVVAYRDGQRIPVAEAMESLSLSLNQ